jgi:hypothetical protein
MCWSFFSRVNAENNNNNERRTNGNTFAAKKARKSGHRKEVISFVSRLNKKVFFIRYK